MKQIKWVTNTLPKTKDSHLSIMAPPLVEQALTFHSTIPGYTKTPLVSLPKLAEHLGIFRLCVKDESYRFGLNAFKVLGSSYAMAKYIEKELELDESFLDFEKLTSPEIRSKLGQVTFFTATDGNHGRGVAWAANKLQQNAVVFMPKGSTETRLQNIQKEGATATILNANYDECVRIATVAASKTPKGVIIQDTAWEGYEKIPTWIMEGYGTMAAEAHLQLQEMDIGQPTHIFLQAGVGSMAGAVTGYFHNLFPSHPPTVVIVEADTAACLYKSALLGTGATATVTGHMKTIMAGLACGEANILAWDILVNHASAFLSVPDETAALGMRVLAAPKKGDSPITSGESGAAPLGALVEIMTNPQYQELKESLRLTEKSRVLIFSTEGDTDPGCYENIVWHGAYPGGSL